MSKLAGISETLLIAIVTWAAAVIAWLVRGEVKSAQAVDRVAAIERVLERLCSQAERHDADLSAITADAKQVSARLDRIEKKLDTLNSYLLGRYSASLEEC